MQSKSMRKLRMAEGAGTVSSDPITVQIMRGALRAVQSEMEALIERTAGSPSPDCTEIYQEGIIVPPVRLAREGVISDELLRVFYRNSRFPEMVKGDTRASIAAIRLGQRRLGELFERFGRAQTLAAFERLIAETECELRAKLRALLPEGEHRFTDRVDDD